MHESRFHERQLPVKLECALVRPGDEQTKVGVVVEWKEATKGQIMDREHRRRAQRRILRDVGRGQAGVPVMCMHHFRLPVAIEFTGSQMGRDPAEERKAPMVVSPVAAVRSQIGVTVTSVKKRRINDISQQAAVRQTSESQRDHRRTEGRTQADYPLEVDDAIENGGQAR